MLPAAVALIAADRARPSRSTSRACTHTRAYKGTISVTLLHAPVASCATTAASRTSSPSNEHDLFFAEGYAEGSDRLFQMDLLRRFVQGELSELFGSPALERRSERAIPVRQSSRLNGAGSTRRRARYSVHSATV